jgi:23S rRNA (guanosine2251-2'-O)-methyltransferase
MTKRKPEYPQNHPEKRQKLSSRPNNRPKNQNRRGSKDNDGQIWLYGVHAVEAALANPDRHCLRLLASRNAAANLPKDANLPLTPEILSPREIDLLLPPGAVHQGIAVQVSPLQEKPLDKLTPESDDDVVVVLDQVTDPHNIGAILRSCAAFGAKALIMQARHSPPVNGVVAKAATGALEHIDIIHVTNISRGLEELAEMGYERLGLAEEGDVALQDYSRTGPVALVLGAEGSGMRRLTREKCDRLISLPTSDIQSSLNVSNAAAVTLYALRSGL